MLLGYHPIIQGLLGTLFTWFVTALGALIPFFVKSDLPVDTDKKYRIYLWVFASGVMLAASYWSLLAPCIELSETLGYGSYVWFPPSCGFVLGALFVYIADEYLPHPDILRYKKKHDDLDSARKTWHRVFLLVLAVTIHNIPEGLAVGVGFGGVGSTPKATFEAARHLAIGIGIQNFPEGLAVALPLYRCGFSKWESFLV
eukprot:UN26425